MATPLGHALAGMLVGTTMTRGRPLLGPWRDLWLFSGVAVAADLDFLPGLLMGDLNAYHHGPSHSLGMAMLAGLILALWGRRRGQAWRWGLVGLVVFASHLLLDYLTIDRRPPLGMPLWWPFSLEYHLAETPIFLDISRQNLGLKVLWRAVQAMSLESLLLGPPLALVLWLRQRKLPAQAFK